MFKRHIKSLLEIPQKYEEMFDGTLGKYTGSDYMIELEENAKHYHAKSFPITDQLSMDFDTLVK